MSGPTATRIAGPPTLRAHLAVADDQEELDLLMQVRAGVSDPWTGLMVTADREYRSVTGEPGALLWCPGEPNARPGEAVGVELWDISCLNDHRMSELRTAIFEFDLPGTDLDVTNGLQARPAIEEGGMARSFAVLPETGVYRISVIDAEGGCEGVGDPMLRLLRGGDELAFVDDTQTSRCPTIELSLYGDLHDINVLGYNGSALPPHTVRVEHMTELPELQLVGNSAECPPGTAPLNPAYAEHFADELCAGLGRWHIVRLGNGAAFDGPGYGCNLRDQENEPLGHTFCAPQL